MKNVLIIGGTSSLSPEIIKSLKLKNYHIDLMTYRNINKTYGNYNWVYLNLEDITSINNFINNINNNYNKIIILSGNAYSQEIRPKTFLDLKKYYDSYFFNYIYLVINLLDKLKQDGQIISISSIAADIPILDANYSAVKGGIQSFIRSLSTHTKADQSFFSIAPPTINDNIRKDIAKIISESDKTYNGKIIKFPIDEFDKKIYN